MLLPLPLDGELGHPQPLLGFLHPTAGFLHTRASLGLPGAQLIIADLPPRTGYVGT